MNSPTPEQHGVRGWTSTSLEDADVNEDSEENQLVNLDERFSSVEEGRTFMAVYVLARHVGRSPEEAAIATRNFKIDAESMWHNIATPTRRELFATCERVFHLDQF